MHSPPTRRAMRFDWVPNKSMDHARSPDDDYVHVFQEHAEQIGESARDLRDNIMLGFLERAEMDVLCIHALLKAFRRAPNRLICEPGGVADQLGLSRGGIYALLNTVDLDPHDFVEAASEGRSVASLIQKSPSVSSAVQKIVQSSGQYAVLAEYIHS